MYLFYPIFRWSVETLLEIVFLWRNVRNRKHVYTTVGRKGRKYLLFIRGEHTHVVLSEFAQLRHSVLPHSPDLPNPCA